NRDRQAQRQGDFRPSLPIHGQSFWECDPSELVGSQQGRDHIDRDDDRPGSPQHAHQHGQTRLNAMAKPEKAANNPTPSARKIRSAMCRLHSDRRLEDHVGA
ncbi:hypothetical protein, partial [Caulobacter sp. HMWF025]|uniref:hypothetical protein n=1 Tax=Caulobacter sp. HMWF025 TaxID=2056860 RepID=UPI001E5EDFD2